MKGVVPVDENGIAVLDAEIRENLKSFADSNGYDPTDAAKEIEALMLLPLDEQINRVKGAVAANAPSLQTESVFNIDQLMSMIEDDTIPTAGRNSVVGLVPQVRAGMESFISTTIVSAQLGILPETASTMARSGADVVDYARTFLVSVGILK